MATFRLYETRSTSPRGAKAFWVNALTQDRARAILARTFEPGVGSESRWLDAARTICLQDRGEVAPRGVISMGALAKAE